MGDVPIAKGARQVVGAVAAGDLFLLLAKGHRAPIEMRMELMRVVAPVATAQTVGRLWAATEGKEPAYVLLVASTPVARASWWLNFTRLWEYLLPSP
ncbi:MAG: hypothetical protein DDT37_01744 [Firmicutes bacterium]|nr:hypothetical protein [candidate division NPL-UPA2 bacterium]